MAADTDFLKQFLAGRDLACPRCDYNLRDLEGDRCPECGDQLKLAINPVQRKQAACLTGLMILAAGAGLNGLLTMYWVAVIWRERWRPDGGFSHRFLWVNLGGLAGEALALTVWLIEWKRICRLPGWNRWALAIGICSMITLADLITFCKIIN